MADFKELVNIELNSETKGYFCYWEKQDLADGSTVDIDWDFDVSLRDAIKFLMVHNFDTDYAIRKVVIRDKYYKEDEY